MTKRVINIVISVVLFLLPLVIIPLSISPLKYNIPKIVLLYICGLILLICLFIKYKELSLDKADIILLIFIVLVFLSTFFSVNIKTSILGTSNRYEGLLTFMCYYLIYYFAKYYFDFNKKVIRNSIIVIFITSTIALMQFYNMPFVEDFLHSIYNVRSFASSTFGNRNFFGSFISICLPYVMCLYIFYNKKIYLFVSGICFAALIATLTRSVWFAFLIFSIIGIIYILKQKNKDFLKRSIIIFFVFLIIFFILIFTKTSLILGRYESTIKDIFKISNTEIYNNNYDNTSTENTISDENSIYTEKIASGRNVIWDAAIKIIKDHPILGCGTDTFLQELKKNHKVYLFYDLYPVLNSFPDKAHNEFLQIGATIGLPALFIYLSFLFMTLKNLKNVNLLENIPAFIIFLCLISYLIQAFFNISTIGVAPIFYFLLGYSYQQKNIKNNTNERKS